MTDEKALRRDVVLDTATGRVGEVMDSLTKDSRPAAWLRPCGGGKEWTAFRDDLQPARLSTTSADDEDRPLARESAEAARADRLSTSAPQDITADEAIANVRKDRGTGRKGPSHNPHGKAAQLTPEIGESLLAGLRALPEAVTPITEDGTERWDGLARTRGAAADGHSTSSSIAIILGRVADGREAARRLGAA